MIRPGELAGGVRAALGQSLRFQRSGFDLPVGLRLAAAVAIALVVGRVAGDQAAEASLGAGALLVGVTAANTPGRASPRTLAVVALALGVSTFVGSATSEVPWLHTAVLVPWCVFAGLLIGLGPPVSSVGSQGLAAMIVFGRFAERPVAALHLAAFVLAGGAIAVAVMTLTQVPVTGAGQRRAVAGALRTLGALCSEPAGTRRGLPVAQAIDDAEQVVALGLVVDSDQGLALQAILDVARRARLEVLSIEGVGRRARRRNDQALAGTLDRALEPVAAAMESVAGRLEAGRPRGRIDVGPGPVRCDVTPEIDRHLAALAGQVRAIADLAERVVVPGRHRRFVAPRTRGSRQGPAELIDALRSHARLSSPVGRHAVRLAAAVLLAEIIARHSPVQRGYWIALTASVVLRPEFAATFGRGVARMFGTCVGVLLGGLIATAIHGAPSASIVAIAVLCAAAGSCFRVGYALFTAFLTSLVVQLVGIVSPATLTLAGDRLVDSIIGGVLALAIFAAWPTWGELEASAVFAELVSRQRAYLSQVLTTIAGDEQLDEAGLSLLARRARLGLSAAEQAWARTQEDPAERRFRTETGRSILAGLGRVVLATHALRSDLRSGIPGVSVPELVPVAAGLDDALGTVAAMIGAGGGRSHDLPALREAHDVLVRAVGKRTDVVALLAETDDLVDAVDTVAGLIDPLRT